MHKYLRLKVMGLILTSLLGGCSNFAQNNPTAEFPVATQFPQLYQGKLRAAAHWQIIAQNEADLLASALPNTLLGFATDPVHESPINSKFAVSYRHMLTQNLLKNGMSIKDSNGDFDLSYHIQVVEHADRRQWQLPSGFWSAVTATTYMIAHAVDHWSNPELLVIPAAVALDIYNHNNADSYWWRSIDTEIVLTTAVRRDDQILYSNTSVYYFQQGDRNLYDGGKTFNIVSAQAGDL